MNEIISEEKVSEKTAPTISVALPVYNGERYLAEAIDSILAQTFIDFELIIIDDGSTDASQGILRDYEKRDDRIRLIFRENRGLVVTLNEIIDLARGKWIARMDQDDIALSQRFEKQLRWLEKTGADICGSWVHRFGSIDSRIVKLRQTDDAIKMEMLFGSPFAHPAVIMKTNLVRQLRYDEEWENAEDYDLWVRAAKNGWKMTNVPEVLMRYRVHPTQISSITANSQQQLTQQIQRRYWAFMCRSMDLNKKWVDEVKKFYELPILEIDMDAMDALFATILSSTYGESRAIVFDHVTRLYFRAAVCSPNINQRWGKLNREFGKGWGWSTKLKLMAFRLLRIQIEGQLFKSLKKIHVCMLSR